MDKNMDKPKGANKQKGEGVSALSVKKKVLFSY